MAVTSKNTPGPKSKLSYDELKVVSQLDRSGYSQREIASALGVSQSTIRRALGRTTKLESSDVTWDSIAGDPELFFRNSTSLLEAFIKMSNCWTSAAESGCTDDFKGRIEQRHKVLAAFRAEKQRRSSEVS